MRATAPIGNPDTLFFDLARNALEQMAQPEAARTPDMVKSLAAVLSESTAKGLCTLQQLGKSYSINISEDVFKRFDPKLDAFTRKFVQPPDDHHAPVLVMPSAAKLESPSIHQPVKAMPDDLALGAALMAPLPADAPPRIKELDQMIGKLGVLNSQRSALDQNAKTFDEDYDALGEALENGQRVLLETLSKMVGFTVDTRELGFDFTRVALTKDNADFLVERASNRAQNLVRYIERTQGELDRDKAYILESFGINADPNKVELRLKPLGGDAHNGGAVPLLVEVRATGNDEVVGRVVYKPRRAETDAALMRLFDAINHLPDKDRSGPKIATCGIINLDGDGSLWQFVPSKDKHQASVALDLASYFAAKPNHTGAANLARLEQISRAAGITDLHIENVLLTPDDTLCVVDAESFHPKSETGLYGHKTPPDLPPLTTAERELVQGFLRHQAVRESRLVPVPTSELQDLGADPKGGPKMFEKIVAALGVEYRFVEGADKTLARRIENDVTSGDIPIFTLRNGTVYYGPSAEGEVIARAK